MTTLIMQVGGTTMRCNVDFAGVPTVGDAVEVCASGTTRRVNFAHWRFNGDVDVHLDALDEPLGHLLKIQGWTVKEDSTK